MDHNGNTHRTLSARTDARPIPTLLAAAAGAVMFGPVTAGQSAADQFEPYTLTEFHNRTRLDVMADVDGDGEKELVSTWQFYSTYDSPIIRYYDEITQPFQRWIERSLVATGSGPHFDAGAHDVVAGDLTGDGREEVVLWAGHGLRVYGSDMGAPALLLQHEFGPHMVNTVAAALAVDFDGDGLDDLVLVNESRARLVRSSLAANGDLVLTETAWLPSAGHPVRLAAMDVTGSNVPELVLLVDSPTPELWTISIDGGTFGTAVRATVRATTGGERIDLAPGDLDGDGDLDAILFGHDGSYQVVTNVGGALSIGSPRVGGPATDLADWDQDGDLDGICCGGSGASLLNDQPSEFHISANLGGEMFEPAVVFAGVGGDGVLGVLDFDRDGDLDILGGRSVLFNNARIGYQYCPSNPNSTGAVGWIEPSGSSSRSVGTLELTARDLPAGATCLLIGGLAYSANNTVLWDGRYCLNNNVTRLSLATSDGAGRIEFGGPADWWPNLYGIGSVAGMSYGFQAWHRDSVLFGSGANITSAVRVILLE